MMRRWRGLLLVCCCAAGAWAQQAALPLEQAGVLGEELFAASSSTGMVMVVVRGDKAFVQGYGETAPGSGVKPGATSVLRLCSLTKIFTSDLLVKMVQDGAVRMDDPLQRFVPAGVRVPERAGRAITLEELATHTSGLPREVGNAPRGTPHFTFPDYRFRWRWLPLQRLKTTPGRAALYSNVGFDLLGDALQKAAGEPYARLLQERTTGPLGMRETGYTPTAAQCARLLKGAHDEGPCTDTQESAGSSGLYSTAVDMAVWLKYLLGTGLPEIPAQSAAAEAVYVDPKTLVSQQGLDHAGAVSGIGLGWMHLRNDADASSIIQKTGGGAGFTTYIALSQKAHMGVFVAFTEGATFNHFNVFQAANGLLLQMAGLPPMPVEPVVRKARRRRR